MSIKKQNLINELLHKYGFCTVENDTKTINLLREANKLWKNFFNSEEKYNFLANIRNYDGFVPIIKSETAPNSSEKDIKEFYRYYELGRKPYIVSDITNEVFNILFRLSKNILKICNNYLGNNTKTNLSETIDSMIDNSVNNLLRITHYPPLKNNKIVGMRCAEHKDLDLITLLPLSNGPGLQLFIEDTWIDMPFSVEPNKTIILTGEMLEIISNGYYQSMKHRVINPRNENENLSRISIQFFAHPRDDARLNSNETAGNFCLKKYYEYSNKISSFGEL